jgi:hypothetical protein
MAERTLRGLSLVYSNFKHVCALQDTLIGIHPDEEAAILCAMRESLKTSPPCISSDRLIEERANAAISVSNLPLLGRRPVLLSYITIIRHASTATFWVEDPVHVYS